MRLYRLSREEGLEGWRLKRKRLSQPAASKALQCAPQSTVWALDFVTDTIGTGRGIRSSPLSMHSLENASPLRQETPPEAPRGTAKPDNRTITR